MPAGRTCSNNLLKRSQGTHVIMSIYLYTYLHDFLYWRQTTASSSLMRSFSLALSPSLSFWLFKLLQMTTEETQGPCRIYWVNGEPQANTLFVQKYFKLFSGAKRMLISDGAYLLKGSTQFSAVTFHFNGYWKKSVLGIAFPYLCKNSFMPLRRCAKRNKI